MFRFCALLLVFVFCFLSCENKRKSDKKKKEDFYTPPKIVTVANPLVTLLDTCFKPAVLVPSEKGNVIYTIQTKDVGQTITVGAPVTKYLPMGEAGGFTFMQNFNTEQGLALSSIACGYRDKVGNLWFGTYGGGVSRYDGKSFTNFTIAQGLAGNIVRSIVEDKKGNLWFGTTGGGVSKYDGQFFETFTTAQGLVNNKVSCIMEDKTGNLWFGTSNGISKLDPCFGAIKNGCRFTNYTTTQGVVCNDVSSIIEDKKGNIWFGTSNGISKYNSGTKLFTNFTSAGTIHPNVSCIIEDKMGNIWFGTYGSGLCKYDGKLFTNFSIAQGLLSPSVNSIMEDGEGNLWFGTYGGGVSRYDGKSFTNFTTAEGLANNTVFSITNDKMGDIWFGTYGGGLSKYDGKSVTSFSPAQGLVSDKVWSITEDRKGNLWFATSSGISEYIPNNTGTGSPSFTNYSSDILTANVRGGIEDKMGNLWFGISSGASKYDGKSFTYYSTAQGMINNGVYSIIEDKKGNIWFGTNGGGIVKYDGNRVEAIERGENIPQDELKKLNGKLAKSFTNYTTAHGLVNNSVKCIAEDKKGNIWFGTKGSGVSRYDGTSFVNYTTAQGLANNTIYAIKEDRMGNLWFATAGGGISKLVKSDTGRNLSKKIFINYTTIQGLASDVVYAIVEDSLNNILWFGTNLGISGLHLNTLSLGEGNIKFENFNNHTGYPIKDINTGSMYMDSKGILWAGTGDKLVRFDYKEVNKSTEPPVAFIQSLKIQEEKICWNTLKSALFGKQNNREDSLATINEEATIFNHVLTDAQRNEMHEKFADIKFDSIRNFYPVPENLVLPYTHNNITFDYGAIETGKPQLVRYQYFLAGYDNRWGPVTDKSTATFGNIYEGTYTFKLKAQSPDGIWSEPILYTFRVLPPWYRTWWMYCSYVFVVSIAGALFFRWRTAALRKEKEILERTVTERTKEVVEQKELIEEKQKEIVDSINYAKRIQYTLLAHDKLLQKNLKEYFVLFQPKDIVSGDFYWATEKEDAFYLAICDSTGHGVPGAFMSLLNISFLNEAINEKNIKEPNEIFNHVRQRLIESISQEGAQDGMDGILLCLECFPSEKTKCTYAAANNAPLLIRNGSIIELPTDKMPVGKGERGMPFTFHTIDCQKGDVIYFYTDGYADQFGGPKGKKFKYKQLNELLLAIHQKPMDEQENLLKTTLEKWKGNVEQVDDVLIIGITI